MFVHIWKIKGAREGEEISYTPSGYSVLNQRKNSPYPIAMYISFYVARIYRNYINKILTKKE